MAARQGTGNLVLVYEELEVRRPGGCASATNSFLTGGVRSSLVDSSYALCHGSIDTGGENLPLWRRRRRMSGSSGPCV